MNDIHGGNINKLVIKLDLKEMPEVKYDFSVNLNPLGPPEQLIDLMSNCNYDWQNYPDSTCAKAVDSLAKAHDIIPETLTVGNGATELFALILTAFNIKTADYLSPCYSGYKEACVKTRVKSYSIKNLEEVKSDAVFIGYPNNPTGHLIDKKIIFKTVCQNSKRLFIADESFMDFVIDSESKTFINSEIPDNLIIVKSSTKMFNIAGIRLGMAVSNKNNIEKINQYRLPWSVNAIAQKVAIILYEDKDFIKETKTKTKKLREELSSKLSKINGITIYPSDTNFLLFKFEDTDLQKKLLLKGIFIRSCEEIEGLMKGYFRIAVKNKLENCELIKAIESTKGSKK
jgi:histidinol-phosphate/aromatic aminotransferase/cobyric acid decarboxylase-like protein